MPEYGWPGGRHGFAMWFSGAPDTAKLDVTEFWHPSLREVCDNSMRSAVASAKRGEIRWNKRDKATKALAHFTVTALAHLLRTDGAAAFGYSGPMIKTLYNAFKRHGNRSDAMKNIFRVAGTSATLPVFPGQPMEQVFIAVEGAEDAPVVRMSSNFHNPSAELDPVPIYVFWEEATPSHPNWELTRVVDLKRLENLAELIAKPYIGPPGPPPDKPEPDATLPPKRGSFCSFLAGCMATLQGEILIALRGSLFQMPWEGSCPNVPHQKRSRNCASFMALSTRPIEASS